MVTSNCRNNDNLFFTFTAMYPVTSALQHLHLLYLTNYSGTVLKVNTVEILYFEGI